MKRLLTVPVVAALAAFVLMTPARADDLSTVKGFYTMLSSTSDPALGDQAEKVLAKDWESIGDYSGKNKSREMLVKQLGGFGKLIPDLKWTVEEIIHSGDRYVVRGRATGTPAGPFFGVDGQGRSFEILSIDIHTVENGKIVRSYHVEDWAGALGQLKGK